MRIIVAAIALAGWGAGCTSTANETRSASATEAEAHQQATPILIAADRRCVQTETEFCDVEAAEFAGIVQLVENCVLIDSYGGGPIENRQRNLFAVLFPEGVTWSVEQGGIVTTSGAVADVGDWIYGGGGSSPIGEFARLDDDNSAALRDCAALSDHPDTFWEMGSNSGLIRLDGPPEF